MYSSTNSKPKLKPKYPHAMYHTTKKPSMVMAKTVAEHDKLMKQGYTHTKPKK
jgi:hypothetical protein